MSELLLRTNPFRYQNPKSFLATGIYVQALDPDGKAKSVDIALLDAPSLFRWLRSRGGDNPWAENTVALLLGHEANSFERINHANE